MKQITKILAGIALATSLAACSEQAAEEPAAAPAAPAETAEAFVARANAELKEMYRELGAAAWVRATYITADTAIIAAANNERYAKWHSAMVKASMAYDDQELDAATRRGLNLLKLGTSAPAPSDPAKRKEISAITTELEGMYGAGQYCRSDNECISGSDLEQLMADTRDYDELLDYWKGWRTIAPPMRDKYERFVELANEGANELGYENLGEMWRAN